MRKAETVKLRYVDDISELPRKQKTRIDEKAYKRAVKNAMEVGRSVRAFYGDDLRGYYESRDVR